MSAEEEFIIASFETLPKEPLFDIILNLDSVSRVRLCSTNPAFRAFCTKQQTIIYGSLIKEEFPGADINTITKEKMNKIMQKEMKLNRKYQKELMEEPIQQQKISPFWIGFLSAIAGGLVFKALKK